jgi:hypothetical protein
VRHVAGLDILLNGKPLLLSGNEPGFFGHPSHSLVTLPTELPWLAVRYIGNNSVSASTRSSF